MMPSPIANTSQRAKYVEAEYKVDAQFLTDLQGKIEKGKVSVGDYDALRLHISGGENSLANAWNNAHGRLMSLERSGKKNTPEYNALASDVVQINAELVRARAMQVSLGTALSKKGEHETAIIVLSSARENYNNALLSSKKIENPQLNKAFYSDALAISCSSTTIALATAYSRAAEKAKGEEAVQRYEQAAKLYSGNGQNLDAGSMLLAAAKAFNYGEGQKRDTGLAGRLYLQAGEYFVKAGNEAAAEDAFLRAYQTGANPQSTLLTKIGNYQDLSDRELVSYANVYVYLQANSQVAGPNQWGYGLQTIYDKLPKNKQQLLAKEVSATVGDSTFDLPLKEYYYSYDPKDAQEPYKAESLAARRDVAKDEAERAKGQWQARLRNILSSGSPTIVSICTNWSTADWDFATTDGYRNYRQQVGRSDISAAERKFYNELMEHLMKAQTIFRDAYSPDTRLVSVEDKAKRDAALVSFRQGVARINQSRSLAEAKEVLSELKASPDYTYLESAHAPKLSEK